jgi:hypothetical protein
MDWQLRACPHNQLNPEPPSLDVEWVTTQLETIPNTKLCRIAYASRCTSGWIRSHQNHLKRFYSEVKAPAGRLKLVQNHEFLRIRASVAFAMQPYASRNTARVGGGLVRAIRDRHTYAESKIDFEKIRKNCFLMQAMTYPIALPASLVCQCISNP